MDDGSERRCTAFVGDRLLAAGTLAEIAARVKAAVDAGGGPGAVRRERRRIPRAHHRLARRRRGARAPARRRHFRDGARIMSAPLTPAERAARVKAYREAWPQMGVWVVRCTANGKILVG